MARIKSIAELKRQLKRRLHGADEKTVNDIALDFRSYAVARQFFDYYSIKGIAANNPLVKELDEEGIARAIRNQGTLRR